MENPMSASPSPRDVQLEANFRTLRRVIPTDHLDDFIIKLLCQIGEEWRPDHKTIPVLAQGQPPKYLFVVLIGEITETRARGKNTEHILDILQRGNLIGLEGYTGDESGATYKALDVYKYFRLPWNELLKLAEKHPQIKCWVLRHQAQRLKALASLPDRMVDGSSEQRLATTFLYLDRNFGLADERGRFIRLRLTRGNLANMISARVETVIRIFTRWQKEKIIEDQREGIILINLKFLRDLT